MGFDELVVKCKEIYPEADWDFMKNNQYQRTAFCRKLAEGSLCRHAAPG
jgi:hypothetical protein